MKDTSKSSLSASLGTILFLTSSYPKFPGESSGIFLHYLARQLMIEGWRVITLAPNFPGGKRTENLEGIEVVRFNYFFEKWQALCYRSGMLPNLKRSPKIWMQVPFYVASMVYHSLRLLKKEKINLIHAHWALPQGVVASLVRIFHKVPVVLTIHGGDIFAFRGKGGKVLKSLALKMADACTANSRFTMQCIQEYDSSLSVTVIPMGVDTESFHPEKRDLTLRGKLEIDGEMILFVGRLVEKKGLQHLILAMPEILKSFPRAVLVVVGEGALRQHLEKLVGDLQITASVRFLGNVRNADLPTYYTTADVFVGPSVVDEDGDTEGLGVVFLEAAASQAAIIGTSTGGISDFLLDGVTGVAVQPENPTQLAAQIRRLLLDQELRRDLGVKARRRVIESFSWRHVGESFSLLFQEVTKSAGHRG